MTGFAPLISFAKCRHLASRLAAFAALAWAWLPAPAAALGFDDIVQRAKALAAKPYVNPAGKLRHLEIYLSKAEAIGEAQAHSWDWQEVSAEIV